MATDVKKEIGLEIGHVLFIDIVGYSKLLINEQSEQIQKLKEIVRGNRAIPDRRSGGQIAPFAHRRRRGARFSQHPRSAGLVRHGDRARR